MHKSTSGGPEPSTAQPAVSVLRPLEPYPLERDPDLAAANDKAFAELARRGEANNLFSQLPPIP